MTHPSLTIALLGAQATGKTQLSHALHRHFQNERGLVLLDAPSIESIDNFDVILLMGLDLPTTNDRLPAMQRQEDADLRRTLTKMQRSFHVVYGSGQQRLDNALHSISQHAPQFQTLRTEISPRWTGPCETCGDGACEHRLFTELLKR